LSDVGAGAAVACPAEQRANSAAVVRLMRLVARVLVDVIAVLDRFGEADLGVGSLGMNLSRYDKTVNNYLNSVNQ
jgi:hypothetical protein